MYRHEHPRPDALRDLWLNLNGTWQFEIDDNRTGIAKHFENRDDFSMKIEVPFCPESTLSGIGHTDFINACWYSRILDIPEQALSGRVMLHFGAVDYEATVYLNGKRVGKHRGGYIGFAFDITDFVTAGENVLVVRARDNCRDPMIPSGKQCVDTYSHGCSYTRSTGIWQTVWLEYVPKSYIKSFKW